MKFKRNCETPRRLNPGVSQEPNPIKGGKNDPTRRTNQRWRIMSVIRRANRMDAPYTSIANSTLQDKSISLESKGLLVYLLSKPADWNVMSTVLMREFGLGREKFYRIVSELEASGYVERLHDRNDLGHKTVEYLVYEIPGEAQCLKANVGKAKVGNQTPTKEREKNKGQTEQKLPMSIASDEPAPKTAIERSFDEAWAVYPRKEVKKASLDAFTARVRAGVDPKNLIVAAWGYAGARKGWERDKIMLGSTFWGPKDRYIDFLPGGAGLIKSKSRDQLKTDVDEATNFVLEMFLLGRDQITRPVSNELVEKVLQNVTLTELSRMQVSEVNAMLTATAYDR